MPSSRTMSDRLASLALRLPPVLERDVPARSPAEAAVWATASGPGQRRIVIHAGPPKTGTTAIQRCFRKNREYLLSRGILYPAVAENHSDAVRAAIGETPQGPGAQLVAELAQPGWHTLILSGEGLSHLSAEDWQRVRAWLDPQASRIGVIFAIRDPLEMTRSMIQQQLKDGRLLEPMLQTPPSPRLRQRLQAIRAAFAPEEIRLLGFAEATSAPRGLTYHFARRIGLDKWTAWHLSRTRTTTNPSLSQPAVEALAARNRGLAEQTPVGRAELVQLSAMTGPKFRLPEALAADIRAAGEADLAWIHETFGFVPKA